jgi:hypothetical protein
MATATPRGASSIPDLEFLKAYNDPKASNAQILEALQTDWTAVGVKLRSARLQLHTLVTRTGGAKGTAEAKDKDDLALEAQIFKKHEIVQPQPNGPYISLQERIDAGKIKVNSKLEVTELESKGETAKPAAKADAPAKGKADAKADKAKPADKAKDSGKAAAEEPAKPTKTKVAADPRAFVFQANIFSTNYEFAGASKNDATNALFTKLQELNVSKVQISDNNGRSCGFADIVHGGKYKFSKQLTAA